MMLAQINFMSATMVAQTIQLIIAPTVLLSVCTLVQNGILARYMAVGERMRSIDRERWRFIFSEPSDRMRVEGLNLLNQQIPGLIRRHKLLQDAAITVYAAILVLLLSMFAIALCVLLNSVWLAIGALLLFLGGAALLVVGVFFIVLEIRISHQAICYELQQISRLEGM